MGASIPLWVKIILVILPLALCALAALYARLNQKLRTFMTGKDAASLEATLAWLTEKSANVDETLEAHKEALEQIDERVRHSVRGYALVRYDAYESAGGEQSFAATFLDEHLNGHILSVITNRNHVGVYAKTIAAGVAESTLTDEENLSLVRAKQSLTL